MIDALELLEKWAYGHKSRSLKIDRDNGYGATCWTVELHGNGKHVVCSEVSFFTLKPEDLIPGVTFARPPWEEEPEDGPTWPGLGATILAALKKAEEMGL